MTHEQGMDLRAQFDAYLATPDPIDKETPTEDPPTIGERGESTNVSTAETVPDIADLTPRNVDEFSQPEPVAEDDELPGVDHIADLPGGLPAAIEAVLMVIDEPVTEVQLATALELPVDHVTDALERLAAEYYGVNGDRPRGFELRHVAGGWRIFSHPAYASVVHRFVLDGQTARLTQAALETLAVVAYRQPVSRGRISAIRGVNVDGVVRTLVARGLIEESGSEADSGALLYRTSAYFMERMGLSSLDDLPPLAPYLPDMDGLNDIDEEQT